jgi:hypothetical protein
MVDSSLTIFVAAIGIPVCVNGTGLTARLVTRTATEARPILHKAITSDVALASLGAESTYDNSTGRLLAKMVPFERVAPGYGSLQGPRLRRHGLPLRLRHHPARRLTPPQLPAARAAGVGFA